jgi:hypothetical protein
MTILIAWASLSVGIVLGAAWRALCEKQSRVKLDTTALEMALANRRPEWTERRRVS